MEDDIDPFEGLWGRRALLRIPLDDLARKGPDGRPGPGQIAGKHNGSVEQSQQPWAHEARRASH
jgi:hypothetical protein